MHFHHLKFRLTLQGFIEVIDDLCDEAEMIADYKLE